MSIEIRLYRQDEMARLAQFIERYRGAIPDAKLMAAEFYTYHPASEGGRMVEVAVGGDGNILGFAPLVAAPAEVAAPPAEPHHIWSTIGVSENVIEASWQALLDSMEYYYDNRVANGSGGAAGGAAGAGSAGT